MAISCEEGEHVVMEVRKHWFVVATKVFIAIILAYAPVFLYSLTKFISIQFITSGSHGVDKFFLFIYLGWLLILWMYVFYVWTDYYLDIWIITNKKIMTVEQKGFFNREVSTINLSKIQDVSTKVKGIVETFMGFGDLQVETAGNSQIFIIRQVDKPGETRKKINEVLDRYHNHAKIHSE